ncbi:UBN2_3 domain-containing protein [Senna tora]|uniref:UBN2_3 domain-containing protein n=1 Tax=Senna tora TaxID=362788 RepID=A0A834TTJ8_9FABA|nr:UBN2_3 domain-containing protein [Senna tora]
MAGKSIIAYLNKGDDIWHKKVKFLLEEQELTEAIRDLMMEPNGEGPAQ